MILPNLHDTIKNTVLGYNCVLAFETASDYLGTNKMAYRPKLCVRITRVKHCWGRM